MQSGLYAYLPQERVVFGRPAAEAVAEECERLGAKRAFIIASHTLSTKTPLIAGIKDKLGARVVGVYDGCKAHTPWQTVVAAAARAWAARPDIIVSIGGGTVVDTAKVL